MTQKSNISSVQPTRVNLKILGLLCFSVLASILAAGLWPFHSPRNDVTWLAETNGLHFGKRGTLTSQGAFTAFGSSDESWTVEMWIEADFRHRDETLLSIYTLQNPVLFRMYRYQTGLALAGEADDREKHGQAAMGYLDQVFQRGKLSFLTITSGVNGTTAYLDGVAVRHRPDVRLSAESFNGQLVVGNSPIENDSWTGSLRGLALYNRELTGMEVRGHYDSWTGQQRPNIRQSDGNLALYLFSERQGNVVHNYANPRTDLVIPERLMLLHEKFLDSPWNDFHPGLSYWRDVFNNIVAFVPLGLLFCAYWSTTHQLAPAAIATVILGFVVSLTIEIGQSFLPTRDSGVTDLITNTFGTYLGVALYRWQPGFVRWALSRVVLAGLRW